MMVQELDDLDRDIGISHNAAVALHLTETKMLMRTSITLNNLSPRRLVDADVVEGLLRELLEIRDEPGRSAARDRNFLRRCLAEELRRYCPFYAS